MSAELIAIITSAIALAGLIRRQGQRIDRFDQRLSSEIAAQRDSQGQLGERIPRLEGMIEAAFRIKPPEAT